MSTGRLEAFTDAVIAIVMTIMVLDLRPPAGHGFGDLGHLVPKLLVYALSFTFLAIYWNNHHHLMQVVERVDGRVLWANTGAAVLALADPGRHRLARPEHAGDTAPVVVYGLVLLLSAVAYFVLVRTLLALHPPDSRLAVAIGSDRKGRFSAIAYVVAIGRGVLRALGGHRHLRRGGRGLVGTRQPDHAGDRPGNGERVLSQAPARR